jgi:hypothetical protein
MSDKAGGEGKYVGSVMTQCKLFNRTKVNIYIYLILICIYIYATISAPTRVE